MRNIGFMQGRLSKLVDGRIQAFPWHDWESEFPLANSLGFKLMEWTLDQDDLYKNPLMTVAGRERITALADFYDLHIPSLTGDCFMQAPFYKAHGRTRERLLQDLEAILDGARQIGIKHVLVPLVDNGAIECPEHEVALLEGLLPMHDLLIRSDMKILFESDFPPSRLAGFLKNFPITTFGVNYDIGNSAALGYLPNEEIAAYGHRIDNVHVKDRLLQGSTVPLGTGNANFPRVFEELKHIGYKGNYILQTARADDNDHSAAISTYRDLTIKWLKTYGS